jgi:hypothetical protein
MERNEEKKIEVKKKPKTLMVLLIYKSCWLVNHKEKEIETEPKVDHALDYLYETIYTYNHIFCNIRSTIITKAVYYCKNMLGTRKWKKNTCRNESISHMVCVSHHHHHPIKMPQLNYRLPSKPWTVFVPWVAKKNLQKKRQIILKNSQQQPLIGKYTQSVDWLRKLIRLVVFFFYIQA